MSTTRAQHYAAMRTGLLYVPASSHYGQSGTTVICDCCRAEGIAACIGVGVHYTGQCLDYCMMCVEKLTMEFALGRTPTPTPAPSLMPLVPPPTPPSGSLNWGGNMVTLASNQPLTPPVHPLTPHTLPNGQRILVTPAVAYTWHSESGKNS